MPESVQTKPQRSSKIDPLIGKYVGGDRRYQIRALQARSQKSRVYRAFSEKDNCEVILKFFYLDCAVDLDLREKFLWEMQAIACIHSKRVVRILDFGTDSLPFGDRSIECPYLVSEFCTQGNLGKQLRQGSRYTTLAAIDLILQIIKALQSLYAGAYLRSESGAIIRPVRLLHQNLKPNNIFIAASGSDQPEVRLSDFGAVNLLFLQENATLALFDWRNAAPEDWTRDLAMDERRDVYGCGAIFYQILSGTSPYGVAEAAGFELWQQAIAESPVQAFDPDLGIPRALELLILRCLEKDPQHRFVNIKQLQAALLEIRAELTGEISTKRRSLKPKISGLIWLFLLLIPAALVSWYLFQDLFYSQPDPSLNLVEKRSPPPAVVSQTPKVSVVPLNDLGELIGNPNLNPPGSEPQTAIVQIIRKSKNISNRVALVVSQSPKIESQKPAVSVTVAPNPVNLIPPVAAIVKPIPVSKRTEFTPPPNSSFFPAPLPIPKTKLIPPPDPIGIFRANPNDNAETKKIELLLNAGDGSTFPSLLQRSGELAAQALTQEFALNPQRQNVEMSVFGDRNGQKAPLLLVKVSRNEWQNNPNIGSWAKYITKSEVFLGLAPLRKPN